MELSDPHRQQTDRQTYREQSTAPVPLPEAPAVGAKGKAHPSREFPPESVQCTEEPEAGLGYRVSVLVLPTRLSLAQPLPPIHKIRPAVSVPHDINPLSSTSLQESKLHTYVWVGVGGSVASQKRRREVSFLMPKLDICNRNVQAKAVSVLKGL